MLKYVFLNILRVEMIRKMPITKATWNSGPYRLTFGEYFHIQKDKSLWCKMYLKNTMNVKL